MNYRILSLILCALVLSCSQKEQLTFTSEVFSEKDLAICKNDPCSTVAVDYPVASGDVLVSEKINATLKRFIVESLFLGEETPTSNIHIEEAAKEFVLAYRDHQADLPSNIDMGGYEAQIDITVLLQSETLISTEAQSYLYTGGAHGNKYISYHNFDRETGALIDIEDLVSDFKPFEAFVEQHFRATQHIEKNKSINETGFWFEDEKFYVSNAIGFTPNALIVVYNSGEIGPYALGTIAFEIPMIEVLPYLIQDPL